MSLRVKVLLPLLLFSGLFGLYANNFLLDRYITYTLETDREHRTAHLRSVAEGLVPLMLDRQLANVYSNLQQLLESNEDWVAVRLFDAHGKLLFPLDNIPSPRANAKIYTLPQSIQYLDHYIGDIQVDIDQTGTLAATRKLKQSFLFALSALLLIFVAAMVATLEWLVEQPLQQIGRAADRLAGGDFAAPMPRARRDEMGALVRSFEAMRNAIHQYQKDLTFEVEHHRKTASQLTTEKERASYQASHDSLTGLYNRRAFEERLNAAVQSARINQIEHALLYVDLDMFKVVNDTCGHIAGDQLLRQLGPLLQTKLRDTDTLARLGGDEFGILLKNATLDVASLVAGKLQNALSDFRFTWEDKQFTIGASIGIVSINTDLVDLTQLLSHADAACYIAKDKGRGRIHVYQEDDQETGQRLGEMQWVSRINNAIEENRLVLFCQPIAAITADRPQIEHYEILVRLRDETGKIIAPGAFIPAAERYRLMSRIDRWVISHCFDFVAAQSGAQGIDNLPSFAINLSGETMSDEGFIGFIEAEFKRSGVPTHKISFEITETAAISELGSAIQLIHQLQELGCRFALDDFGSGLSSFGYLKNMPVDYLKIDGQFVRDILEDPIDLAMVRSINEIGHIMGMKTIAEFVENNQVLSLLHAVGVDYAQGYGLQAPFPLEELSHKEKHTLKPEVSAAVS